MSIATPIRGHSSLLVISRHCTGGRMATASAILSVSEQRRPIVARGGLDLDPLRVI